MAGEPSDHDLGVLLDHAEEHGFPPAAVAWFRDKITRRSAPPVVYRGVPIIDLAHRLLDMARFQSSLHVARDIETAATVLYLMSHGYSRTMIPVPIATTREAGDDPAFRFVNIPDRAKGLDNDRLITCPACVVSDGDISLGDRRFVVIRMGRVRLNVGGDEFPIYLGRCGTCQIRFVG